MILFNLVLFCLLVNVALSFTPSRPLRIARFATFAEAESRAGGGPEEVSRAGGGKEETTPKDKTGKKRKAVMDFLRKKGVVRKLVDDGRNVGVDEGPGGVSRDLKKQNGA
mmetsp:Transcript_31291/g.62010  ORF Transcript_31291/g.62010 Transcript_31291/m.62010 type:complete len:110 (-) Transcript_31291:131-460(-)